MFAITFLQPAYLYGLIIVLPMILLYVFTIKRRSSALKFSLFLMTGIPKGHRVYVRHLPFILRLVACVLLIIIIAQPVKSGGLHDLEKTGINIVLALDISTSMKEADLNPNRLTVAKAKAEQFIAKRTNDRIGLVVFGSEALLQCPLTLDHQALTAFVRDINFLQEISSQTAIGNAIAMGVIALNRGDRNPYNRNPDSRTSSKTWELPSRVEDIAALTAGVAAISKQSPINATTQNATTQKKRGSKVIVLITDGRNTSTELDPITAAQIARAFGIKIYTIGIGEPAKNFYPYSNNTPQELQENFYAQSLIDETTLKELATLTSGKYFNVQDSQALELTFKEIDNLEKTTFNEKKYLVQNTRYLSFAYIVFIVFSLELVLANLYVRKRPS
ncbi:hypothetical protein COTS27_00539 [Spirochaetota bacterium]|nr:hypothetical protein COTS27_00539 [Spirochaetota bacterium]